MHLQSDYLEDLFPLHFVARDSLISVGGFLWSNEVTRLTAVRCG